MEELSHSKFSQFTCFIMGGKLSCFVNFSGKDIIIVDVWEAQKIKLYGNNSCPRFQSPHSAENGVWIGGKCAGKLLNKNILYMCK